ncbi:hypothetical protein [Candidatus Nitrososphaera evergladensis]|uniref:hypothetical protein n=1 Tax=Candidatus Nitrososphaera evergladensis TaxID=1459637 RepID=UPI0011E58D21|nr:hypothetical protein [Candidatus Nitrososphaera evergladensis]
MNSISSYYRHKTILIVRQAAEKLTSFAAVVFIVSGGGEGRRGEGALACISKKDEKEEKVGLTKGLIATTTTAGSISLDLHEGCVNSKDNYYNSMLNLYIQKYAKHSKAPIKNTAKKC